MPPDRGAPSTTSRTQATREATTILVVEDDRLMRTTLRDVIGTIVPGARLVEARDGVEALDWLQRTAVDLVVTDHDMPNMDGLSLADRARLLESRVPFIMYTGSGDLEFRDRAERSLGMGNVFRKPDGFESMMDRLHEMIHARKRQQALPDADT